MAESKKDNSNNIRVGMNVGRYKVHTRLGQGGMAEVWGATVESHGAFRKEVVLKTILPHLSSDEEFFKMFLQEAALAASLNHPNIVQIFDIDRSDNMHFIVMEYVYGRTLRQIIRQARKQAREIPRWFVAYVMAAIHDAMDHVHSMTDPEGRQLGMVHGDLTPENVIIAFNGTPKVLDFGIATTNSRNRQSGVARGKARYMPPEEITGLPIDSRSDIFTMAILAFELLAGRKPHGGRKPTEIMKAIAQEPPVPLASLVPDIPPEIDHVVMSSLAKDPDDRPSDCGYIRDAFMSYLRNHELLKGGRRDAAMFVCSLFPDAKNIPAEYKRLLGGAESGGSGVRSTMSSPKRPAGGEFPLDDVEVELELDLDLDLDVDLDLAGDSSAQEIDRDSSPPRKLTARPPERKTPPKKTLSLGQRLDAQLRELSTEISLSTSTSTQEISLDSGIRNDGISEADRAAARAERERSVPSSERSAPSSELTRTGITGGRPSAPRQVAVTKSAFRPSRKNNAPPSGSRTAGPAKPTTGRTPKSGAFGSTKSGAFTTSTERRSPSSRSWPGWTEDKEEEES